MTEFMLVAGAGEQRTKEQVAGRFMRPLLRAQDTMTVVHYDNSIGPVNNTPQWDWGAPLMDAVDSGRKAALRAVRKTPNIPWLVGYSLGAYAVSDFLEDMATGLHQDARIAGAILIGSPRAYQRVGVQGIVGAHGTYPRVPVVEVCNYDDIICSTGDYSILAKLPKLVNALTGGILSREDLYDLFLDLIAKHNAIPTTRDVKLISKYANGTGHVEEYFLKPEFRQQVARVLR